VQTAIRLLSLLLIVTGLVLLGADALASLGKGGQITVRSLEQVWAMLAPGGLAAFKAWLEHSAPWAAQPVETTMSLPGWAITGVPGVLLSFVAGRGRGGAA
jgi:hypothetical protein